MFQPTVVQTFSDMASSLVFFLGGCNIWASYLLVTLRDKGADETIYLVQFVYALTWRRFAVVVTGQ